MQRMKSLLVLGVMAGLAMPGFAQAAPILGSHVDSAVFAAAIGDTAGWTYAGQNVPAFSGAGTAEVVYRSSSYANSFGYSRTDYSDRVTLFGPSAGVGTTIEVTGYAPDYLFFMNGNGSDFIVISDDNRQYTDGHATGRVPGITQGDIDIFHNAAASMWAFFFDDAGGGLPILGDDGDYDDFAVLFSQAPSNVPEPMSLLLCAAGIAGIGVARRRHSRQKA